VDHGKILGFRGNNSDFVCSALPKNTSEWISRFQVDVEMTPLYLNESALCSFFLEYVFHELSFVPLASFGPTLASLWLPSGSFWLPLAPLGSFGRPGALQNSGKY